MDKILTKAEIIAQWPRPRITVLQPKAQAYQQLVDKLEEYENLCSGGTLDEENQVSVLTDIYTACRQWVVEDKGKSANQYAEISNIQDCADKVIQKAQEENLNKFCYKAAKWYEHPWAWNLCYDKAAETFAQETLQFYEAIRKWQEDPQLSAGRQGALYIMNTFVRSQEGVDEVVVEAEGVDPATLLGKPIAEVNIGFDIVAEIMGTPGRGGVEDEDYEPPVAGSIRRAHKGMFDKVIEEVEKEAAQGSMMFDNVKGAPFIQLINNHIAADVIGPFPETDRTYHCSFE